MNNFSLYSLLGLTASSLFIAASISPAQAADPARGKTLFAERCASCHGEKGAGDGPIAAGLPADQKPKNLQLSEKEMKFATSDEKFRELLSKGGGAVGLSMLMPAQSDLPAADVDSLLTYVKSLRTK
jgi:mono/diheme cytochrome c family protein